MKYKTEVLKYFKCKKTLEKLRKDQDDREIEIRQLEKEIVRIRESVFTADHPVIAMGNGEVAIIGYRDVIIITRPVP